MYTERFSLAFVSQMLIAAAERRRPGLGPWSDAVREELRRAFVEELAQMEKPFREVFNDPEYWDRLEKSIFDDCFPRYCAAGEKQTALERRDYGMWRGGDLVARLAYAAGGIGIGLAVLYAPFLRVPKVLELAFLAGMLGAPFFPDLQVWSAQRRHAKALQAIVTDMAEAQQARRLYEPLGIKPAGLEEAGAPAMDGPTATAARQGDRE